MTLLDERLKAHVGGLIRLKTDLYWYNIISWDRTKGKICLILNATSSGLLLDATTLPGPRLSPGPSVAVCLLIDGSPKIVSITEETIEFIE